MANTYPLNVCVYQLLTDGKVPRGCCASQQLTTVIRVAITHIGREYGRVEADSIPAFGARWQSLVIDHCSTVDQYPWNRQANVVLMVFID